jgi:hypothetical protein
MTFKGIDYKEFLAMFGPYKPFPKATDKHPGGRVVYLRHDIDQNPLNSLAMAKIENLLGIQSTYFALNHSPYWPSPATFDVLRAIQDLGHEIGWHQCVIVQKFLDPSADILELMERPLAQLRINKLNIRGTSPHGSKVGADNKINSWQIWSEYRSPWRNLPTYPLSQFGLEYEAMHLYRDTYHSDSGNEWCGLPEEVSQIHFSKANHVLQINIHPQHWQL